MEIKKSSPESAANQFVKIITVKDGQRSMIYIILKKIHLSIKKPMSRLWNKVRQRHYLHQLEDIRNMELMQDRTSTRRKKVSDTITIHVAKSAKKNFLFFDKYEVTSITDTSATIKTVKLFTMPGVTVKVDGIAAKVPENTSGNTYYTRMFEGTHKITFHGADGLFDQTSYTFKTGEENPLSKIKYSDSAKAEAAKELKNYLPKITEAKIRNLGNSGLTSYFTSDQKANSYGTSLCRYIYYYGQDAKALGNVKLTKCQAVDATSSYYTVADGIPVAVQGTRDYKYKNGWTGSYEKQTCTINGVAKMLKKNGKWVIDSVSYYYY